MNSPVATSQSILRGQTERIASVTPSRSVAWLAKITAGAAFLLIITGALVTGNKAAMSDPTWPKFLGSWVPQVQNMVGGIIYEDTHRLKAATVGLLTLALAFLIQFKEPRAWVRQLGWFAVGLVIAQALFGALIIKSYRSPIVSMTHGCLAQAFFCAVVTLALVTSRWWLRDGEKPRVIRRENEGYLRLAKIVTGIVYCQIVLGTGVRHSEAMFIYFLMGHIAGAVTVIAAVSWLALRTLHVYRDVSALRRGAIVAGSLVGVQLILGVFSIFANRARLEPEMAYLHHVIISTAHLTTGALLLATVLTITMRAHKLLAHNTEPAPLADPLEAIV